MSKRSLSIFIFLCLLLCLPGRGLIGPAQVSDLKPQLNGNPSGIHLDFGSLPLYFTANRGQVDGRAFFYAKAARYTLWLTEEGLVFDSFKSERPEAPAAGKEPSLRPRKREGRGYERDVSRLVFLNASKHPEIVPVAETALKVNYFIGNDPAKWHAAVPTSQAVLYRNVFDRIDLKVYGLESRIEYDWIVRPGGDPQDIRFQYENVKGTRVDDGGNLLIETGFGELVHKKPEAYQDAWGKLLAEGRSGKETRVAVESAFKKIGENAYGFEVGVYKAGQELVIDPVVLAYSTYLSGNGDDWGNGIAVDGSGNAYVAGTTFSTNFPTLNQYQTDQGYEDAFVTKVDTTKSGNASLVYSTYLGGNSYDYGQGIAVDGSGNAYVTGCTCSGNFPTRNQYQIYQGHYDVFVTKLDTTKSGNASLVYSTYLSGNGNDFGNGIAIDGSGNAYVTGVTDSTNFPTLNQYQAHRTGNDAFVTKIDTTKSGNASLVYSTYLGGSSGDWGMGIAVDGSGNAYVTGDTDSTNFPTLNQYQTDQMGTDVFVTKIDTTKSGNASLVYSTYMGGSDIDWGAGIAVDGGGNAYVTGSTNSTNFPTLNQYQTDQVGTNVFVTKLDTTKSGNASLVYSTYLGGNDDDLGYGIAVDGSSNAYVTGFTYSIDFPTLNQYQTDQTDIDVFVTKIDTTKSGNASLVYSTYLGGSSSDYGNGIAVDGRGNAYVTGYTMSTDFPIRNQYQTDQAGDDAFVAKISDRIIIKDDFVGAWPGQGVYYRNSDTGRWVLLEPSISSQIAVGDLDGDGIDDFIGLFPNDPGVWTKRSSTNAWLRLDAMTPYWIAVGDMNGDGRVDFVGAWNNGVYYRNSVTGSWVLMETSSASQIAVGDLDGDGKGDLIGVFPNDPGVWTKRSSTQTWLRLDSMTPSWIAVGDLSGDGKPDLLGTWPGSGVYYKDSTTGSWVLLETSVASQVVAGDLDGDGKKDLIGVFPNDPGVWTKRSSTLTWLRLDALTPSWIAAGRMRAAGAPMGVEMSFRAPSSAFGLMLKNSFEDLSTYGPHGKNLTFTVEKNGTAGIKLNDSAQRLINPGPGELGFKPIKDESASMKREKK
jgi:hypothetical protein